MRWNPADIDAEALSQLLEALLQIVAHVAEGDPWRIADDDVRPSAARRKGEGSGKVACNIGPNGVAAVAPELVEDEIGLAEVLDRELLLVGDVSAIVLLHDAFERRFDLPSSHALFRAGPHPLDGLVEQTGVA